MVKRSLLFDRFLEHSNIYLTDRQGRWVTSKFREIGFSTKENCFLLNRDLVSFVWQKLFAQTWTKLALLKIAMVLCFCSEYTKGYINCGDM